MAIIFTKQLDKDNLLNTYNNNVIEFKSDSIMQSVSCEITVGGLTAGGDLYRISPNLNDEFRFNFKDAFKVLINKNNFADDAVLDLTGLSTSITVEDTENHYLFLDIDIKINHISGPPTEEIHVYKVLKSVENIKTFAKNILDTSVNDLFFLTPFLKSSDREIHLTYWEGYPFDIPYFINATVSRNIVIGGTTLAIPFVGSVGRFTISDGSQDISNFIPILGGVNEISIEPAVPSAPENYTIFLTKKKCSFTGVTSEYLGGTYLKWSNKYGEFNYWLFNKKYKNEITTKGLKEIYNDFDNLGDSVSPYLQTGKQSREVVTCHSTGVSEREMLTLEGLFESPKVYLYIAEPGTEFDKDNFIEVKLLGQKTIIKDYKKNTFNINCKVELPLRNTMTIW